MVTTIQMLGAPSRRSRIRMIGESAVYRVYTEASDGTGTTSSAMAYPAAQNTYVAERDSGANVYVTLYKETSDGNTFLAVSGVPTSATASEMIAVDAPYDPPTTEPLDGKSAKGAPPAPNRAARFWVKNKWYILGGAGVLAAGVATGVVVKRRHHH